MSSLASGETDTVLSDIYLCFFCGLEDKHQKKWGHLLNSPQCLNLQVATAQIARPLLPWPIILNFCGY